MSKNIKGTYDFDLIPKVLGYEIFEDDKRIVKSKDDFPTAVGGAINLLDGVFYQINGAINLGTDQLVFTGTSIVQGSNAFQDSITYLGTESAMSGNGVTTTTENLTFVTPNGKAFDFVDTGRTKFFTAESCLFASSSEVGMIEGFDLIYGTDLGYQANSGGWVIKDPKHIKFGQQFYGPTNSGTFFYMSGTQQTHQIDITNSHFHTNDSGSTIFNIDMDINDIYGGNFLGNSFIGDGTFISGFGVENYEWIFNSNSGIPNTSDRDNSVVIRKVDNFWESETATLSGNSIYLTPNYEYIIDGQIDLNGRTLILADKVTIEGTSPFNDKFTQTGTSTIFSGTQINFRMENIGVDGVDGDIFDLTNTGYTTEQYIYGCDFRNFQSLGNLNGSYQFRMLNNRVAAFNDGLTINNNNNVIHFIISNNFFIHTRYSGTGATTIFTVEDDSTVEVFKMVSNHTHSRNSGDKAIVLGTGHTGELNTIVGNDFDDYDTGPLSGFGVEDSEWLFEANLGTPNTSDRSNKTIIRQLSNFPTPTGGTIELTGDHVYEIEGSVNIGTNRLKMGNKTSIIGQLRTSDGLIYTGTESAIYSVDNDASLNKIFVSTPLGTAFEYSATTGNEKTNVFLVENCVFTSCANLGRIENIQIFGMENNLIDANSNGLILTGSTNGDLFVYDNISTNNSGTTIEFNSSVWDVVNIARNAMHILSGDTGINGLANNGNLSTIGRGRIINNAFLDDGTYIENIQSGGTKWSLLTNTGVADYSDSNSVGSMLMEGNATATDTAVLNTWYKISGTTVEGPNISRWTMTDNNELTYDGIEDVNVVCNAVVNAQRVGGSGAILFEVTVFQNGSKVANVTSSAELNTQERGIPIIAPLSVSNGDTVSIYVRNVENVAADFLAVGLQVNIS